ncbi:MAG: YitT family protein [Lachnospiraceae bacterium]|nr:YitT family protein [Lachnospiraceae bacterium]
MEKKQMWMRSFMTIMAVVGGNVLYALTVKLFLLPSGLVTGGTTGIALAVNHVTGLPVSSFVLVFNVVMLIVGYLILGRQFAMTTVASTFIYPMALGIFERLLGDMVLTQDLLLCTVFSGLGIGVSLGVVIRAGASTGGMDIPPLVLQHCFRIPVSVSMYVFDFLILLLQAVFRPTEMVLYGIVLVLIYTLVLDKLMIMGTAKTEIKVVSRHYKEIRDAILQQVDRGVTMLDGEGGYMHETQQVVLSVVSNREVPKVEKIIRAIDPESFLVISRVSEVRGRGFSMSKRYQ